MSDALASLHPDLRDLIGTTIADRYRVDALLGVGGMGAVFRGHHLGLKRDVAIKVLHPDLTRDRELSARFDREAHSASRLDHPNCLQVTDFGSTPAGNKFMVMQLLEGREMATILGRPLPLERVFSLALQILRGLDHAHRVGIVHRDIKPENVFLTEDQHGQEIAKIVDFGIAKLVDGAGDPSDHRTKAGLVFGTPAYMSPEQAAGLTADARADLYAVGIMMYEMLKGQPPFVHEDPVCLVRMQVGADVPLLPESVPEHLATVVMKLLEKSRDERFQTAYEAIEALEFLRPTLDPTYVSGMIPITGVTPVSGISMLPQNPSMARLFTTPPRSATRWIERLKDWRVGAGLAFGVALLTWTAWPHNDGDSGEAEASEGQDLPGESADASENQAGPPEGTLAEIDRLLMTKSLDEADKLLSPLRDQYPENAALMWRQGKLLSTHRRKKAQALAAYGNALDAQPTLIEDRDFYAELYELLRDRRVRDEALDLALHKLGMHGHKFLLEVVNDTDHPLPYEDRQRALDAFDGDQENRALINWRLNKALDILQAFQALSPCTAYRDALEAIAAGPERFFIPRVERAKVPESPGQEDASACEGLTARRDQVLAMLQAIDEAEPEGKGAEPPPKRRSSNKKAVAQDECDKPGALFKRKCWKKK